MASKADIDKAVIIVSAAASTVYGLCAIFAPELLKTVSLGGLNAMRKDIILDLMGVGMISWTVSKVLAWNTGSIREFAVLNMAPLTLALFSAYKNKNKVMGAQFAAFAAAYAYVAWG